jgi:hypothetical protein
VEAATQDTLIMSIFGIVSQFSLVFSFLTLAPYWGNVSGSRSMQPQCGKKGDFSKPGLDDNRP